MTPNRSFPLPDADDVAVAPRRRLLVLAGMGAMGALLSACGTSALQRHSTISSLATGSAPTNAAGLATGDASAQAWIYLAILTGKMDGQQGYPEFVPANFSVAANATVYGEIRCFDDGVASVPGGYETVKGTNGGTMTVIAGVNGELSSFKSQMVQAVDPKNVAHTFTFADIGLNIPIPPLSTVRFTFKSGAAGTHVWQCMSACGSGNSGWGGPMSNAGWMKGTMTVHA